MPILETAAKTLLAGCTAALVLLPSPRAEACSCGQQLDVVLPRPDATEVPLDAQVIYRPVQQASGALSLRSATGSVDAVVDELGERLVPAAPLEAQTSYEILSGDTVVASFVTGDSTSESVPAAPVIDGFNIFIEENDPSNSCGEAEFTRWRYTIVNDPTVAYFLVGGPAGSVALLPEQVREAGTYSFGPWCADWTPAYGSSGETACMGLSAAYLDGTTSEWVMSCDEVDFRPFVPQDPEPEPEQGGCQAASGTESGAWLLGAAMLVLASARRRRAGQ